MGGIEDSEFLPPAPETLFYKYLIEQILDLPALKTTVGWNSVIPYSLILWQLGVSGCLTLELSANIEILNIKPQRIIEPQG